MWLVLRRIDLAALANTFRTMRVGWFAGAVVLYGFLFLPASWRWHLALRLTHTAVHPVMTAKLTLIGHFFYAIFFGGVGGDAAKSAFYARWTRMPLAPVLVSATLDRLFGLGGLIVFTLGAFGLSNVFGGFSGGNSVSFQWPWKWILIGTGATVLLLIILRRTGARPALEKFADSFRSATGRLVFAPKILVTGLFCGLLMQLAMAGTLALNLQAVSHIA